MAEVIEEAEIVPDTQALDAPARPAPLSVIPAVGAGELVARLDTIKEVMRTAMQPNVDYGVIPGTGSKPTLLKPGAEKLAVTFQLDVETKVVKHRQPDQHLIVEAEAIVRHAPTQTP